MKDMDIYRYLRSGWQAVSATLKYSIKLAGLLPVMCFTLIFGANAIAQTLTLTEVVQLLAGDGMLDDQFGVSVALDGDTVLIGAKLADNNAADTGVAYVFTRDGATWTFQDKLFAGDGAAGDDFGESVALIGNTAVIGARQNDDGAGDDSGSAYVFTRDGAGAWSQQQKLTAGEGAAADDEFGTSVAFDGNTILIGHPGMTALRWAATIAERLTCSSSRMMGRRAPPGPSSRNSLPATAQMTMNSVYRSP